MKIAGRIVRHLMYETEFGWRSLCGMVQRDNVRDGTIEQVNCGRCLNTYNKGGASGLGSVSADRVRRWRRRKSEN